MDAYGRVAAMELAPQGLNLDFFFYENDKSTPFRPRQMWQMRVAMGDGLC